MEFHARCLKNSRCDVRSAFWGPHDGQQHFGVQIPQNPSKMAFYKHVRASANGLKTNDVTQKTNVIGLQSLAAKRRILFIASGKILQLCILQYLQRNDSVSWCTIFGTEIQFLQNLQCICFTRKPKKEN